METYTPTPETRKELIETYVHELKTDRTPQESLTNMCWTAVMSDFNGKVTTAQNKAVITFMVAFFANLTNELKTKFA
tara:strand:- start:1876 stop:2106 length:231 start_codon:yes stop_codon:yes gene_type:complete